MGRRRRFNIVSHRGQNSSHLSTINNEESQINYGNSTSNQVQASIDESVASHSIPSDIEASEDVVHKATRGPTRMLDVWDMQSGDFICVNLDEFGRPIGEEAKTLTRFIGTLVRKHQYAPINYKSWKLMPKEYKEDMLKLIESKFEFVPPINEDIREMLKLEMNDKWRHWKHDLKKVFDPSKTEEEITSTLPDDRVDPNQYRDLVHHWFSEEGQKICEMNKRNRAKLEDIHCMGTKSLPVMIDEKKKKNKVELLERHLIYIDTRTRKDGTIVNEKAASIIDEFKKHMHEGETSQTSQNTQSNTSWKDDLFSKIQGPEKRGRVRCLGKMPMPQKSKSSSSENADLREEVRQMKGLLTNVLQLIQNRFPKEDLQDILQRASVTYPVVRAEVKPRAAVERSKIQPLPFHYSRKHKAKGKKGINL